MIRNWLIDHRYRNSDHGCLLVGFCKLYSVNGCVQQVALRSGDFSNRIFAQRKERTFIRPCTAGGHGRNKLAALIPMRAVLAENVLCGTNLKHSTCQIACPVRLFNQNLPLDGRVDDIDGHFIRHLGE